MDAIRIKNLSKQYGKKMVLEHLEMTVPEGAIYGFIGQNGAGKSTTQKLICGLTPPTGGEIQLYGKPYTDAGIRSQAGMLIEQVGAYPGLTAGENLILYGKAIGIKDLSGEINRVLKLVKLEDTGKKKVKQFSLGMKQRLGIAIALLGNPKLLILDEPINGLDPEGIQEFRTIVTRLNEEYGMTILISSHILGELSKISTHYGIIKNGTMIMEMSAEKLKQECWDYLCIRVERAGQALETLKQAVEIKNVHVEQDKEIQIDGVYDTKFINKYLLKQGFEVEELFVHKQDLEDYFLNFTGGTAYA